jgi:hypothetical protein
MWNNSSCSLFDTNVFVCKKTESLIPDCNHQYMIPNYTDPAILYIYLYISSAFYHVCRHTPLICFPGRLCIDLQVCTNPLRTIHVFVELAASLLSRRHSHVYTREKYSLFASQWTVSAVIPRP